MVFGIPDQLLAVIIFGAWVALAPWLINKFADSRSQPRIG
jgi:hypothetical protein